MYLPSEENHNTDDISRQSKYCHQQRQDSLKNNKDDNIRTNEPLKSYGRKNEISLTPK